MTRNRALLSMMTLWLGMLNSAAAQVFSGYYVNPVGQCDAALPTFDAMLRKRPTAIANMGDRTAFISCSTPQRFDQDSPSGRGPVTVLAFFDDPARTSDATVTCTLVDGVVGADAPDPDMYVRAATFEAGSSSHRTIEFDARDYGLARFRGPANLSCALPAGIEINDLHISDERDF